MHSSLPLLVAVAVAALACGRPVDEARGELRLAGASMGTTWSVRVAAPQAGLDAAHLRAEIESILARIDQRASTWRDDSELARFNASRSTDWQQVSGELAAVASVALRIGALSDGALDVTVLPLVLLWGFGPAPRRDALPTADEIEAARARIGLAALELREDPPALRKAKPELALDLSALAKGHAVDEIARRLEERGLAGFLVELGGELRARGTKADGRPWRVGIERGRGAPLLAVLLVDRAIATSGDAHQAFELAGRRYPHVIDPRRGEPVANGVVAATVVAPLAIEADALATALMVLGPEAAHELAERAGFAYHMDVERDGELVERSNAAFDALVAREAP